MDVRRPPLGFNTWNHFHMHPTEAVILETAANFTSMGLRDAGYLFINTDDGWLSRNRSSVTGSLVPMPDQFPSGIPALTDKLHGMGFRFGIYACASEYTCGSRAGSLFNERRDAETFARWGVDYIKFDDCGEMNLASYAKFNVMRDALKAAGRPMVYSFEPYTGTPKRWVPTVGNAWRTGPDALPTYASIIGNAFVNNMFVNVAGPGHFNDADMMVRRSCVLARSRQLKQISLLLLPAVEWSLQEIGNGNPGLSVAEARTQMALWCLMKSPLLIGASLQQITQPYLQILLNKELIAWNQDSMGLQGYLRASATYSDGDARGALPSRDATIMLSHISAAMQSTNKFSGSSFQDLDSVAAEARGVAWTRRNSLRGSAFRWVTYCAFATDQDAIPSAQRFTFTSQRRSALATIHQGHNCLTAPAGAGGGAAIMAICNGSSTQLWHAEHAATTLSPITTGIAGLCLASDGLELLVEPCIKRPQNCSSLWNHNSATDGIDCTDDVRSRQFWYLNAEGQLTSAFIKGKGTQHHPEIVFYDPDDPLCVATAAFPKPSTPDLPPVVNYTLPLQVWAGELSGGAMAVVLMNTGARGANINASWRHLGLATNATMAVRNVYTGAEHGTFTGSVGALVGPHDVAALTLTPIQHARVL